MHIRFARAVLVPALLLPFLAACSPYARDRSVIPAASPDFDAVYRRGDDGYACFRIPAIVATRSGTLLAFAEGRKNGCSDTGDIDLVLKRSEDGGVTWSGLQVVWSDSTNTCGNPAPVVDRATGAIHLLSTWNLGSDYEPRIIDQTSTNTRRVFHLVSVDDGLTWSAPRELTGDVKRPGWTWYATGPGSGIQLTHGERAGRLMVACDHIEAGSKRYYSHVIFSDDRGLTWRLGGTTPQDQVNESEVAELSDGRLLLNMRNYDRTQKTRKVATSDDGGLTWSDIRSDPALIEPICQASLERYPYADREGVLLFSNPASTERRERMTLRVSFDDGASWPDSLLLHAEMAAYSDLVIAPDSTIGILFEAGLSQEEGYRGIVYRSIDPTMLGIVRR